MPVSGGGNKKSSSSKKKKKDLLHSILSHSYNPVTHVLTGTGKGLYRGATGLPTGAYALTRAGIHDIRHDPLRTLSPGYNLYQLARGRGRTGKIARAMAKSEYEQYRHFGRGGDVSGPLLDAMAIFSLGGSAAARTAQAARGAKAVRDVVKVKNPHLDAAVTSMRMGHPLPKHVLKTMGITEKEVMAHDVKYGKILNERVNTKSFIKRTPGGAKTNAAFNARQAVRAAARGAAQTPLYSRRMKGGWVDVAASPNPTYRMGRRLRELTRGRIPIVGSKPKSISVPSAGAKIKIRGSKQREVLKEVGNRQRRLEQIRQELGRPSGKRARKLPAEKEMSTVAQITGLPMNLLRITMVMRPRYTIQNTFQTLTMLGVHPVRAMKAAKILAKNPELRKMSRGATGGGVAKSTAAQAAGPGAKAVTKMFDIANWPEQRLRALSLPIQMQRAGIKSGAEMESLINQALKEGVIGSKKNQKTHQIIQRAEEEVGAFARQTPGERAFMRTQIPIFYPMFKALLRYGYRFPSEHPLMAAGGLSLGKQGKAEQHRLLGDLPFWGQYLIPKSAGDPNAKPGPTQAVFNPSNLYNLQPATDISLQAAEMFRKGGPRPGVSFLQETGPLGQILNAAFTGRDLQTGYPIITKRTPDWQRRAIIAALTDYLSGIPGADLTRAAIGFGKPHLRSYEPESRTNLILQQLFGPGFVPRDLITKETSKQAKRETKIGRTKGRKKRKKVYKDNP